MGRFFTLSRKSKPGKVLDMPGRLEMSLFLLSVICIKTVGCLRSLCISLVRNLLCFPTGASTTKDVLSDACKEQQLRTLCTAHGDLLQEKHAKGTVSRRREPRGALSVLLQYWKYGKNLDTSFLSHINCKFKRQNIHPEVSRTMNRMI